MTTLELLRATSAKSSPSEKAHDLLLLLGALVLAVMVPVGIAMVVGP